MIKRLINRFYSDYCMPSRLDELEEIYLLAKSKGYEFHSIISFWDLLKSGEFCKDGKYFISRHDIDTDLETAYLFFKLEKRLGVISSFYFRLKNIDAKIMREINYYGSEASYHYEEIATLAKRKKWHGELDIDFDECRREFIKNFNVIKACTGLPLRSICSHGDFANRKIDVVNHMLLTDELRNFLGIELETYDQKFMNYVGLRCSDYSYPKFYVPMSPVEGIKNEIGVIYFLTHPRHWRRNWIENTKENLTRLVEGVKFNFK